MATRFLVANTCEDGCGIRKTGQTVEGAPVYRCPGCDSTWIELDERRQEADDQPRRGGVRERLGALRKR